MAFPTVHDPSSTHVCGRAKARTPDSLVELTWRLLLIGFSVFCVVIGVKLNNRIMLKIKFRFTTSHFWFSRYVYSRGARKARGSTGYHSICFQDGHKKWFYGVMESRKWYRFSPPHHFRKMVKTQCKLKNNREIQDLTSIAAEMTGDLGEALIHSQSLLS